MNIKLRFLCGWMLLLFSSGQLKAQDSNLFSTDNSLVFADYLVNSRQLDFALLELERVLIQRPGNDTIQARILEVYDLRKDFKGGLIRALAWSAASPENLGPLSAWEYLKLSLHNREFEKATQFSRLKYGDNPGIAVKTQVTSLLLRDEYKAARRFIDTSTSFRQLPDYAKWTHLVYEGRQIPRKSPVLALALSTPIPGLGRIYAGSWKDGLFSMALVGSLGFQTYRAFERDGISSVTGWIFSAATAAFYGGNLYGSFRAAKLFNQRHRAEYRAKVEENLLFHP